jgi:hypothetical protein
VSHISHSYDSSVIDDPHLKFHSTKGWMGR